MITQTALAKTAFIVTFVAVTATLSYFAATNQHSLAQTDLAAVAEIAEPEFILVGSKRQGDPCATKIHTETIEEMMKLGMDEWLVSCGRATSKE